MGYNGGINKRGYYRRNHGMISKSSMNFGSKILTNSFLGGLGLMGSLKRNLLEESNKYPDLENKKVKHFNPIHQRLKFVIFGIIAILCPIAGFVLFEFFNWWIFFSVLICGFIEIAICMFMISPNAENSYVYKAEEQYVKKVCNGNLNILRGLFIILFALNLYPILFDLSIISYVLVCLKLLITADLIRASFKREINIEAYANVISENKSE
ncbi:hypothetical protein [Barnesiella viscericola]|uniref:Uncharacterized protein n=1 Tax=Barnesiella viscericola TaxID=397865 RepID=A0A921MQN6_9BACT|nr:hypothetical protein [Barnesiella viscericola]HJG88351.1 hypothetical protein [Barnesiella viscericola]